MSFLLEVDSRRMSDPLNKFSTECLELLNRTPSNEIPVTEFAQSFQQHFGRELKISNYGPNFKTLAKLLEAVSSTVEVVKKSNGSRIVRLKASSPEQPLLGQGIRAAAPVGSRVLYNPVLRFVASPDRRVGLYPRIPRRVAKVKLTCIESLDELLVLLIGNNNSDLLQEFLTETAKEKGSPVQDPRIGSMYMAKLDGSLRRAEVLSVSQDGQCLCLLIDLGIKKLIPKGALRLPDPWFFDIPIPFVRCQFRGFSGGPNPILEEVLRQRILNRELIGIFCEDKPLPQVVFLDPDEAGTSLNLNKKVATDHPRFFQPTALEDIFDLEPFKDVINLEIFFRIMSETSLVHGEMTSLLSDPKVQPLVQKVVDATRADQGNVSDDQIRDLAARIVFQKGFLWISRIILAGNGRDLPDVLHQDHPFVLRTLMDSINNSDLLVCRYIVDNFSLDLNQKIEQADRSLKPLSLVLSSMTIEFVPGTRWPMTRMLVEAGASPKTPGHVIHFILMEVTPVQLLSKWIDLYGETNELKQLKTILTQDSIPEQTVAAAAAALESEVAKVKESFERMLSRQEEMQSKVFMATILQNKIEDLRKDPDYLSEEEVDRLKAQLETEIKASLAVEAKIHQLTSNNDFLDEVKIKLLEDKILQLKNPQQDGCMSSQDLECTICLSLPEAIKDAGQMFSCQQHHMICRECLRPEIQACPVCRQDFQLVSPLRNYLAERLVRQHWESHRLSQKSQEFEIDSLPEDIKRTFGKLEDYRKSLATTIEQLQVKLIEAKSIHAQIRDLRSHKDLRSEAEIQQKISEVETKIFKARKIEAEIDKSKAEPFYLDPQETNLHHRMIGDIVHLRQFLKNAA